MSQKLSRNAPLGEEPRPRIFYGWRVVASVFVIMTFSSGLGFYNISVILSALTREQGFSVSLASAATAVFFVVSGFAGLSISKLIVRYDIRYTIIGGAALAGISMMAISYCTQIWQVFVVYAVFGIGFSGSNMVPCATLITRWFERGRAKALSIASTGLSFGGMLLTPISASMITHNGLASAMPWVSGLYMLGIIIPAAFMLKPDPALMGLGPDGGPLRVHIEGKPAPRAGTPYDEAIRSRFFIFCVAAYLLIMLAQVGSIAHHFNLVTTRISPAVAATSIVFLSVASAAGRLAGGWFASRYSLHMFAVLLMIGQGISQFTLAGGNSVLALLIGSTIFGLTVGNILMLMPLIFAQAFGLRDYARIYSQGNMISAFGMAAGPLAVGLVHDWLGGYGGAYAFVGATSVLGAWLLYRAGPIPKPNE
ncbi:MAG: MFS transporter [Alphaproteobacteria bacterium]|nr:MFS transporter [Alphaproteobacteria bacterium]